MQASRPPPKTAKPRATGIDSGPLDNGTLTSATLHRLAPSAAARKAEFRELVRLRIRGLFDERMFDYSVRKLLDTLAASVSALERDNRAPKGTYAEALEEYLNALRLLLQR